VRPSGITSSFTKFLSLTDQPGQLPRPSRATPHGLSAVAQPAVLGTQIALQSMASYQAANGPELSLHPAQPPKVTICSGSPRLAP